MFGTGTQAYWHARLVLQLFPSVKELILVAREANSRATSLMLRLQTEFEQVEVALVTPEQTPVALAEADIVCCCVPSTEPLFEVDDLKDGVHVNAIGSYTPQMQEFPPALIAPSSSKPAPIPRILVDSRSAVAAESGEVIASGIKPEDLIELGDLLTAEGELVKGAIETAGLRKGGRSLFKCVGVGAMDVSLTHLVVRLARELGVGTLVDF